jgi:hypothetical protein
MERTFLIRTQHLKFNAFDWSTVSRAKAELEFCLIERAIRRSDLKSSDTDYR